MQEPLLEYDLKKKPQEGFGYIYMITSPSEKSYIGQTRLAVAKRWKLHCCSKRGCTYLLNAIHKYGKSMMSVSIIGVYPISDLNDQETIAIKKHKTRVPHGYNINEGGGNRLSVSDTTKRKQSEASLKMWATPGFKERHRAALLPVVRSEEYRENMSASLKHSDAAKTGHVKAGESMKQFWSDPENKERMRKIRKETASTPEFKEQISLRFKEKWQTDEYRSMQLDIMKKRWDDDDFRKKMSEAQTGRKHTAETKAKIAAGNSKPHSKERIAKMRLGRWGKGTEQTP